jgi:hypothetical protein
LELGDPLPKPCYVILHIGTGPSHYEEKNGLALIVKDGERFALRGDIWIERLEDQVAKKVQKACEPPHYNIDSTEYNRHLYAFVRRVPDRETRRYEGLEMLHAVLALSRLIQPTSIGDRYCAQIFHYGLPDSAIYAIQYRGISPDVFLSRKQRDWLTVEDGKTLRGLMPWLSKDKNMHHRVHRAYWYHEYVMRSSVLDIRLPLATAGLEALINSDKNGNRKQFCTRVPQLAKACGVALSDTEMDSAWTLRSKLVHAEAFLYGLDTVLPATEHLDLYEKLETVLRNTVRQCLLDESFGDRFRDKDAVDAHWPLKPWPTAKWQERRLPH